MRAGGSRISLRFIRATWLVRESFFPFTLSLSKGKRVWIILNWKPYSSTTHQPSNNRLFNPRTNTSSSMYCCGIVTITSFVQ